MSLSVNPVKAAVSAVSSFAPTKVPSKSPFVLDESIPRPKIPVKQITISIMDKLVEAIKKKPESERKLIDYAILFAHQLMKLNPAMYAKAN